MLTPNKIVAHLQTYLPASTDVFTEFITVNTGTVTGGNVLNVNAPNHGLSVDTPIVVKQGRFNIPIVSVTLTADDQLLFETEVDHDQNYPDPNIYGKRFVTLSGFTNNAYNTTHELMDVPNRENFLIDLPEGETGAPSLTGNEFLVEFRTAGITGLHTVDTIVNADNFTIVFDGFPEFPNEEIENLQIARRVRVAAAADYERAKAIYTKYPSNENWLFVIMLDVDVSKDRYTLGDADAGFTAQDYNLLNLLQNFATTCFIGTHDELSGSVAQEKAYGEVFEALLKTLYGFTEINQGSAIPFVPIPRGHGPAEAQYNSAYYPHAYEWQLPITIDYSDGFTDYAHVAFRDISMSWNNNRDIQAKLLANIDLDREELP